jgi:lipoprotein-releasing system permease protein
MNLHFFIARRYLTSPKTTHIINIISSITSISFAIGTMAIVIIISIFNGLESLIVKRFNSFDSDFKIVSVNQKVFKADAPLLLKITSIGEIEKYAFTVEETALIKYHDIYHPFTIKGVDLSYSDMTGLDTMMTSGHFSLIYQDRPVAVIGMGVSAYLSVSLNFAAPLSIYVPNRLADINSSPENAFIMKPIYPVGIYSIDPEMDNFVIVPIFFARELLSYTNEASSIEIKLKPGSNAHNVQKLIQKSLGPQFYVKNRFEQHALIYHIMKSEKVIVFLILLFILLIASFNITASLTMLILEKKEDINTLQSIGLSQKGIRRIFLYEGWLIAVVGTLSGVALGLIFCFLQHQFGIIPMEGSSPDAFIVKSYPVEVRILDIVAILVIILGIGYLSSRFPVRFITKRYLPDEHEGA